MKMTLEILRDNLRKANLVLEGRDLQDIKDIINTIDNIDKQHILFYFEMKPNCVKEIVFKGCDTIDEIEEIINHEPQYKILNKIIIDLGGKVDNDRIN